jgi:hypothetical protein
VPWLRRLVAGLSPRRAGFDPVSVHMGFVVVSPCQFHSTGAQLHGKTKNLVIFITGLHNKPQDCSASVASAAGPFYTQKETYVTPTNALFFILFVLSCTRLLHVSALLSRHFQGADTKVSIRLTLQQ